ncbi:MAG: SGNH/GDSL hydrolase family protein [Steroidobacteraceae bacterium]
MRKPRLLFVFLALLTAALTAEAFLRISDPRPLEDPRSIPTQLETQERIRHGTFAPESDLGALLAPLQHVRVETPEFSYKLRTDHAGFPNLDPWPEQLDVAVMGNSLITGAGVGYEGQFTTLMQKAPGSPTVLNFGIPGGGTAHQLGAYRKFVAPLQPRIVVATLWITWEIDNSLKFHDWLDDDPRPTDFTSYRLTYRVTEPKSTEAGSTGSASWREDLRNLIRKSRVLDGLHGWSKSLRGIREPVEQVALDSGEILNVSARDQKRLLRGWERPVMPDIRQVFFEPLEQLRSEVEAQGGRFLVVLFPCKEELYGATVFPELLVPVEQARAELEARGIPTLDLYPVFARSAYSQAAFHKNDMHMNARGHEMTAQALVTALLADHKPQSAH